jgi:cold shock protein
VISRGVVRDFRADEGWGVVDGPDVPGGCWVHFSAIMMGGYRRLTRGQWVSFHAEVADQDGFEFRATTVWPDGGEPTDPSADHGTSTGHRGSLVLTFDQPEDPGLR